MTCTECGQIFASYGERDVCLACEAELSRELHPELFGEPDRTCRVCGGSGGGPDPALYCRNCNGTGEERPYYDTEDDDR